jgi:arsenical pump membrane protein
LPVARRLQSNEWVEQAFAYSTLALTVTLAVSRPRLRGLRVSPGSAALLGVALLMAGRLVGASDLTEAARVQWRPLLSLACIMLMTGAVKEVGAFERLAARAEAWARTTSTVRAFTLLFVVAALVPALLNNDSAILLLTPLVVPLAQRLIRGGRVWRRRSPSPCSSRRAWRRWWCRTR